jgi:hypothetical protein
MNEAPPGCEVFRQRYMIHVHDANDASRLLGMGVESALLDWPKRQSIAIKLGGNELSLWLPGPEITQIEQVEQIVNLGVRVVTAWRFERQVSGNLSFPQEM